MRIIVYLKNGDEFSFDVVYSLQSYFIQGSPYLTVVYSNDDDDVIYTVLLDASTVFSIDIC